MADAPARRFTVYELMLLAQGEAVDIEDHQKRLVEHGFREEPHGPALQRAEGFKQIAAILEWLDLNRDAVRNAVRDKRRW